MNKNLTVEDVCRFISTAKPKDLYFIQKTIELKRQEKTNNMFEGATNL
tara:strand:- start:3133 stop:3276 length:144 start_codon:yes stop_codon:yes gene_type:complete